MYRPLPDELTIKNSPIEGLGLFATSNIKANSFIGITHIRDEQFENKYIRTPLGGFINHSDDPNCQKYPKDQFYFIKTIKEIKKGEELFLNYTFYKIN